MLQDQWAFLNTVSEQHPTGSASCVELKKKVKTVEKAPQAALNSESNAVNTGR